MAALAMCEPFSADDGMIPVRKISASVVDDMISSWRRARLSSDAGKLLYPKINILHPEHGVGEEDEELMDDAADTVQEIVDSMPTDIRTTFEAFHIGVIRGDYCRDKPHKFRWLVLGLTKDIYESRERLGWGIIREALLRY